MPTLTLKRLCSAVAMVSGVCLWWRFDRGMEHVFPVGWRIVSDAFAAVVAIGWAYALWQDGDE